MDVGEVKAASFNQYFGVDEELSAIIGGNPAYSYLVNPAVSNIYQYLTDYVGSVSERIHGSPRSNLSVLDWGRGKVMSPIYFERLASRQSSAVMSKMRAIHLWAIHRLSKSAASIVPLRHPWTLPFESNSFDVVVSYGVLEHVPNDLESLREINRILKPGGLFFCFHLPRKLGYIHFIARQLGDRYHDRLYTRSSCAKLIEKTKFRLLDIWERSVFPKNRLKLFVSPRLLERLDHVLVKYTPLRLISTNVEFVAQKDVLK